MRAQSVRARSVGTFIQIDRLVINLALVEEIEILENSVQLYYRNKENSNDLPVVLVGEERLAFLDWWEREARVTQIARPRYLAFESGATLVAGNGINNPEEDWEGANINLAWFEDLGEENGETNNESS